MRKLPIFFAVLSLFLLPASIIWAQTISSQRGLTTAVFNVPQGTIKVYLPDDIRPGDIISGSVIVAPIGKNINQEEKNRVTLSGYVIDIGDNKVKPGTFKWTVPPGLHQSIPIILIDLKGKPISQLPLPVNINNNTGTNAGQSCTAPSHVMGGSPFRVGGAFDGDASNTKCTIGGRPAEVLAESPRQTIVTFPPNTTGPQKMEITESNGNGAKVCDKNITGVKLDVTAGKLNLLKGEKTTIGVQVTGLEGLPEKATLTLDNITTATVTMAPVNNIVIVLNPADVSGGTFTRSFEISSIRSGGFTVNVDLDLPNDQPEAAKFEMNDLKNESGLPGSYGYIGDQPCNPEGTTTRWRWHKTFICQIDERAVLPCGHTKAGNEVYEKIKELLEELELDKATDIGEKMAKAFSTSKTFSYSIHVIRKWVEYDIDYKCVDGKWQPTGGIYVRHGTDDLGWHSVKQPTLDCWLTFDSPAAEKEFSEAVENALRNACR